MWYVMSFILLSVRGKVGVMKDEKLEKIEASYTLGLVGEVDRVKGRGEGVNATLVSYGLKYISLTDVGIKYLVGFR